MHRAKSTTFKSYVESLSLQDGDVRGSVVGGGGRCRLEPNGRRTRASSMPGRMSPPSYGSTLTVVRRGARPRHVPSTTVELQQQQVVPPTRRPETVEPSDCEKVAIVGSPVSADVAVTVSPASIGGSTGRISTPSSATRRRLGSTSFTFRRKRILGVPVDENNVPQIDRAASPIRPPAACPTATGRDAVTTREAAKQPIYPRRFASLRLPSGARSSVSSTVRHPASSTLLSPAAAANGASDHRPWTGSYHRMQLLQNIGKHFNPLKGRDVSWLGLTYILNF